MRGKSSSWVLFVLLLAGLVLAGTYMLAWADEPMVGAEVAAAEVGCKKTATPLPTKTATPEPTVTSTLWTPQPPVTVTPKPPKPPTVTPTVKPPKRGHVCFYPDRSVLEVFDLATFTRYISDPDELEVTPSGRKRAIVEVPPLPEYKLYGLCTTLPVGEYRTLCWNEKDGHAGLVIAFTVTEDNHQEIREGKAK